MSPIKWKAGKQVSSASGDEENMNFRQWLVTTLEGDNADEIAEVCRVYNQQIGFLVDQRRYLA